MSSPSIDTTAPHDARAVANLLLHEADRIGISITNLTLQKILFFAHAISLREHNRPLVDGYFEAWKFGPVHPLVYQSFKVAGRGSISFRAKGLDIITWQQRELAPVEDSMARWCVLKSIMTYGSLPPGRLVEIAHAPGGPWDHIMKKAETAVVFGMRITDDIILKRFWPRLQPVSSAMEAVHEDTPVDADGGGL